MLGFRRGRQEVGLDDEVLEHLRHLYSLSQNSTTPASLHEEANVTQNLVHAGSPTADSPSCGISPPAHTGEKGGHSSPSRSGDFRPTRMQSLLRKLPPRSQTHKLANSEVRGPPPAHALYTVAPSIGLGATRGDNPKILAWATKG